MSGICFGRCYASSVINTEFAVAALTVFFGRYHLRLYRTTVINLRPTGLRPDCAGRLRREIARRVDDVQDDNGFGKQLHENDER